MRRLILALALLTASPAFAATRFYVVVRGVEDANGVKSGIKDEALSAFKAELAKRPELTTVAPAGLPSADDPEALHDALVKRGIKALELTLRIMSVTQEVKPPAEGKQYRQLVRGIKLSVFGDSIPDKVLSLGGDGESMVASEVGANANLDKEGKPLLVDACKEAVKQAVDMTVAKLQMGDKKQKLPAKKKAKTKTKT
ncbi:MAG TPA: hypothetical protein VN947_19985 [Polyangia bacterium]|nr:hypothetical protein [Polyangia bacterium]